MFCVGLVLFLDDFSSIDQRWQEFDEYHYGLHEKAPQFAGLEAWMCDLIWRSASLNSAKPENDISPFGIFADGTFSLVIAKFGPFAACFVAIQAG